MKGLIVMELFVLVVFCFVIYKLSNRNKELKSPEPPLSDRTVLIKKYYYQNGGLEIEVPYVKGKQDGTLKWYYRSGAIEMESTYIDGKKEGMEAWYYESGAIASIHRYFNDTLIATESVGMYTGKEIKDIVQICLTKLAPKNKEAHYYLENFENFKMCFIDIEGSKLSADDMATYLKRHLRRVFDISESLLVKSGLDISLSDREDWGRKYYIYIRMVEMIYLLKQQKHVLEQMQIMFDSNLYIPYWEQ